MNRAYSLLNWKAVDEEKRIIEGIATTPEPDRMGDIVETEGIKFVLPLPLLYQHNSRQPIGRVLLAKVTKTGISVKAQVASPGVAGFIDEAWALIKEGLVRGLSIGFRTLEEAWMKDAGGFRIIRSEWLELSVCTIPANSDANITSVKSIDQALLAASGDRQSRVVRLDSTKTFPGASGVTGKKEMTIKEQITNFENKRAANEARMTAIMEKAGETGSTLDQPDQEEYDTLEAEVKSIDEHLVRLKAHEKRLISTATAVTPTTGASPEAASAARGGGHVVQVRSNLPKGTTFSRWVMAQVVARGDQYRAADIAKQHWPDHPEVELIFRAAVAAGTTTAATWALPLVQPAQQMAGEFYELLRPASIIGRIPGLHRVPANIVVPLQTGGGTGNWVGENAPKPVSALAFTSVTLRWAKAVVLTVLSKELMKFSNPSAEEIVRNSIIRDLATYLDAQFVSTQVATANVSPAGILNGSTNNVATGVTAAAFLTDFKTALATFIAANYDLSKLVILMSSTVALNVSTLKDSLGNFIYPNLSMTGGNILGIPVVVSEAVGNKIIFVNADEILLADDGGVEVDASDQASILMDDNPAASPTTTALVSLYQRNLVAIRVEQFITWIKARSTSVYFISTASYTG